MTCVPFLGAQETSTEREAAREVLRKMDELEKSLSVSAIVARLTGANPARDQVVARARDLMKTDLLALGDDITRHPEIGFKETRSVQKLTEYLKQHDFEVKMGIGGLDTAFVARYKGSTGSPTLGVITSTTHCGAPCGPSTAISTVPRDLSAWLRPSPCRNI